MLQSEIESVLGTIRLPKETWPQVFARVNSEHGMDIKTLTAVIIILLEAYEEKEQGTK